MQLPRGDQATARLHRDWLKSLPAITGKKLTTLAKEIKVSPSTLTRPVSEGEHGTSTLHAATITKIVAHTGVAAPADMTGSPLRGRTGALRGFGEDAVPFAPEPGDAIAAAVKALTGGSNTIAPFTLRSTALELAGFMPGDIVLVDLNASPRAGDAVCAQVYDWPNMRAETVMRIYASAPPVALLIARSTDPALVPLVVDGDRVLVKGVLLPHRLRAR
jgi:hypothetical protein